MLFSGVAETGARRHYRRQMRDDSNVFGALSAGGAERVCGANPPHPDSATVATATCSRPESRSVPSGAPRAPNGGGFPARRLALITDVPNTRKTGRTKDVGGFPCPHGDTVRRGWHIGRGALSTSNNGIVAVFRRGGTHRARIGRKTRKAVFGRERTRLAVRTKPMARGRDVRAIP